MRSKSLVFILIVVLVAIAFAPGVSQAQDGDDAYARLARRALSDIGTRCANLEDNSVCYGFPDVTAAFQDDALSPLEEPGDRAELTLLKTLQTTPLDLTGERYGVAVLSVRANLPKGLPKGAVYTLLGDVELINEVQPDAALVLAEVVPVAALSQVAVRAAPGADAAVLGTVGAGAVLQADAVSPDGEWVRVMFETRVGWVSRAALDPDVELGVLPIATRTSQTPMQAFSFRTGAGTAASLAIPPSVLVVQSPDGSPVDIVANGVALRIDGVAFLRTLVDGRMQVIAGNGVVLAFPDTPRQVRQVAGTSVIFPGDDTWTEWRVLGPEEWGPWSFLEIVWDEFIGYQTVLIIQPSGIDEREIEIWDRGRRVIPYRTSWFPEIPFRVREPGRELERLAWEPIEIGCGACLPDLVFYHSDATGDWNIYRLTAEGLSEPANNVSRGPASQDIQPSYSADAEWVAFTTDRDFVGGWEIYIASATGDRQYRVTFNSADDINPVFGPAEYLAWESNRDGNWELYMTNLSTDGLPVRLTDDEANDINPFWFPDGGCEQPEGARLVFQSDRDGDDWDIFMLEALSGELTQLTFNDVEDQMPVLSADGAQMAWLQMNDFGVYDLWLMDLATRETQRLTDLGVDVQGPVFSQGGRYVGFYALAGDDTEIMVVDVTTGVIKVVTDNEAIDSSPTFYCDRPIIVYHSDLAGTPETRNQRELYEVNPLPIDGPANLPTRLTLDEEADDAYAVADPRDELNSKQGRQPEHP